MFCLPTGREKYQKDEKDLKKNKTQQCEEAWKCVIQNVYFEAISLSRAREKKNLSVQFDVEQMCSLCNLYN